MCSLNQERDQITTLKKFRDKFGTGTGSMHLAATIDIRQDFIGLLGRKFHLNYEGDFYD